MDPKKAWQLGRQPLNGGGAGPALSQLRWIGYRHDVGACTESPINPMYCDGAAASFVDAGRGFPSHFQ
jgi:hypothetical protein